MSRSDPRLAATLLRRGFACHQAGDIAQAAIGYAQALRHQPDLFDALHLLGVIEAQRGNLDQADRLLRRALRANPRSAEAHLNRGKVLSELRRPEEALASYDRAVALDPASAQAHHDRGIALAQLGRREAALEGYDRALALRPDFVAALHNRGLLLAELKRRDAALESYERALALAPDWPELLNSHGFLLAEMVRHEAALARYDRAVALRPDYAEALANRGASLAALQRPAQALASYDAALALLPKLAATLSDRGVALVALQRPDEALASFDRAIALAPDLASAYLGRGLLQASASRLDLALADFDRSFALAPDPKTLSARVFALDFHPDWGFAEHQAARRAWYEALAATLPPLAAPAVTGADPERRLVVGYVSADFKTHSAAACFGSVLRHRDPAQVEIVCYSGVVAEDALTEEIRGRADRWRAIRTLDDDALAAQIRADGIDILVDLSGHSEGNRLPTFARKPAPIQITAWGHATGTGLPAIDYLFSDPVALPLAARPLFAEAVYDLPCLVTFEPPADAPPVGELPMRRGGGVTFGCLNRFSKVSPAALALWAELLRRVPGSRLLLKDRALDDPGLRAAVTARLAAEGIAAGRLELRGGSTHLAHLATFGEIDVALDPWPQNGGISSFEALWMGVPVVALLGNGIPSRLSAAILSAVGLDDWVAADAAGYVALAARQVGDPAALAALRAGLRARLAASDAGNGARYAGAVEAAYRAMWRRWCAGQRPL